MVVVVERCQALKLAFLDVYITLSQANGIFCREAGLVISTGGAYSIENFQPTVIGTTRGASIAQFKFHGHCYQTNIVGQIPDSQWPPMALSKLVVCRW